MKKRILLPFFVACCLVSSVTFAQDAPVVYNNPVPSPYLVRHPHIRKFYVAGALDGAIFSTATVHRDGVIYDPSGNMVPATDRMGILRFTYFLNLGFTFNFNFSRTLGLYTGIDLKNIGYIDQDNGFTDKRRTYNVGVPLAIKIGNMRDHGNYFFAGGGLDVAVNYKEKFFKERDNKIKIEEWWSNRTPRTMPYVFAGMSFRHHITAKIQYYTNNFMNVDYQNSEGNYIYRGTDVHLILVSVGFGMRWSARRVHKKEKDYRHHSNAVTVSYGNQ